MKFNDLLRSLNERFSADQVLADDGAREAYGKDWSSAAPVSPVGSVGPVGPPALAVVLPRSVADLVTLVGLANEFRTGLVPSGGRTGLSGGAVAAGGEIVVSFARMDRLLAFDAVERTVRVEAGMVTRAVQDFAASQGLHFAVDFAAAGSSQIGGNVATNVGGVKVIRHGTMRDHVAGLRVVTGRGDVLDLNRGLVKNAAGYDLRHLLIGSEGTLGLIAEVTLKLSPPPGPRRTLVLAVRELPALLELLAAFREAVVLNAFEMFCEASLQAVVASHGLARPFAEPWPFYALVDFECPGEDELAAALQVAEHAVERGLAGDAVVAQDEADCRRLWRLREGIAESINLLEPYKNDLSVTISRVPAFLAELERVVRAGYPDFEVAWFGHIGDGNLHLNILRPPTVSPAAFLERCEAVNEEVFEVVKRFEGSISAEHGVGLLKKKYLHYSRSEAEIEILRGIKAVFDPNGILNPGKIFDP